MRALYYGMDCLSMAMGRKIRGRFGSYCTLVGKPKNSQLATSSSVGLTPEHLYVSKITFFAHIHVSILLIKNPANAGLNNSLLPSPLFIHYVHSYLEAETHLSSSWFCPHNLSPWFINSLKAKLLVCILEIKQTATISKIINIY